MRVVAWSLLGMTAIAALVFLWPGPPKSFWLIVACALSVVGPGLAVIIAGYVGPLKRRPRLYLLFPAASMGGQAMFLLFIAGAIASEHFGAHRIAFNVNWLVLVAATIASYVLLSALVAHLRGRWEGHPEMACPLVAYWMALALLGLEMYFHHLRTGDFARWIGFLPNALPHLIMGSIGFWLFVEIETRQATE
jgi:hypothetical protein